MRLLLLWLRFVAELWQRSVQKRMKIFGRNLHAPTVTKISTSLPLVHTAKENVSLSPEWPQNRFTKPSASSNATLALLGKELSELHLQALIGDVSSTCTSCSNIVESLLWNLGYKFPSSETGDTETAGCPDKGNNDQCPTFHQRNSRLEGLLTTEEREQKSKQAAWRSDFVQQIVLSTFMDER